METKAERKAKARFNRERQRLTIISQTETLPWPLQPHRKPCRAYHPEDLWELGALRKAIFRELNHIDRYSLDPGTTPPQPCHGDQHVPVTVHCLTHILHCWHANIRRHQAAGPEFLIHFLQRRYAGQMSIAALGREDKEHIRILKEACGATCSFELFLGRFDRVTYGPSCKEGNTFRLKAVEGSECALEDVVHTGGKKVRTCPRVTEGDLLDEWYFEDKVPDVCESENGQAVEFLSRSVSTYHYSE